MRLVRRDDQARPRRFAPRGCAPWSFSPVALDRPINRKSANGRAVIERQVIHVDDVTVLADTELPAAREDQDRLGLRVGKSRVGNKKRSDQYKQLDPTEDTIGSNQ